MMRYMSMRKDAQKPHKIRKWVWGGFGAAMVLLIGVGITVGILVANNKDRSNSNSSSSSGSQQQQSAAETPFTSNETTLINATAIPMTIVTSNSPIAVPISSIPAPVSSPSMLNDNNNNNNNSTSTGTTFAPSILNRTDDIDNMTTTTTLAPAIQPTTITTTTTTTAPTRVPIVTMAPAPITPSPTNLNEPTTTVFYAHGDIPYEAAQTIILEEQMKSVPLDAEFVIFVGDMRDAGDDKPCVLQEFTEAAYLFRMSHAPVFVIQGDNDVSDCPNYDEGKELWMNEFVGFESKYWNHTFDLQRLDGYPDNFAFVHKQSLFIGLNIIGGDTRDVVEWETRLRAEAQWTIDLIRQYQFDYSMNSTIVGRVVIFGHANPGSRHASFFQAISSFINYELMNSIPIVYINGDKHEWMYTENFYDNPSWLRIGVTGLGAEPLLRVTVEADGTYIDPAQAFELERFL